MFCRCLQWSRVTFDTSKKEAVPSILAYGEVAEYVKGFASFAWHRQNLQAQLEQVSPYPLTDCILERHADIRRLLRPLHKDMGYIDTLIAATALKEKLTLITIDRDFERVPQLGFKVVNLKAS